MDLTQWPTVVKAIYKSKRDYQRILEEQVAKLTALQLIHYASHRHALLVIFQGMDPAGGHSIAPHEMSKGKAIFPLPSGGDRRRPVARSGGIFCHCG